MAKFVMKKQDSKFGAPQGNYIARYVGTVSKTHPEYGPGLEFQFEIIDGVYRGKIISRTTAPEPTTKNSCGAMLKQLSGGTIDVDQEIDEAPFVGKVYQVMVGPNSTGSGTRIETLMPYQGTLPPDLVQYLQQRGNGTANKPAVPAAPPAPPPPASPAGARPQAPPPPAASTEEKFWVTINGEKDARAMTKSDVQRYILSDDNSIDNVMVMTYDQSSGWKTARSFGFEDQIPF